MLLTLATSSLAASEIGYDSGNRRDPFIPLTADESVSSTETSSGIKLEGIIYDPGERSIAILNGKPYQLGETVGNSKVVKILKDRVVILTDGEEKTLWLRIEEKT